MLGRRTEKAEEQKWHFLPEHSQMTYKEIPNDMRGALELKVSKGNRLDVFHPAEVLVEFDRGLNARVNEWPRQKNISEAFVIITLSRPDVQSAD